MIFAPITALARCTGVSLVSAAALAAVLLAGVPTNASAQGSISGHVSGSNATFAAGMPNAGVQFYDLNSTANNPVVGTATTDASGDYTFALPAGSYAVLTQNTQGYINKIYNNTPVPPSAAPRRSRL